VPSAYYGKRCLLVLNADRCLLVFDAVESHEDRLRSQPVSGKNSASSSSLADVQPSQRNLRAPPRNGSMAARSSTESASLHLALSCVPTWGNENEKQL
jgi:hypothetical protein